MAQTPIAITEDLVFKSLANLGGRGTRDQVEAVVAHNKLFSEAEVSRIGNDISRELSRMASEGLLDDSGRVENTQKRVYSISNQKLPARKSKSQVLQDEIDDLKEKFRAKASQVETLILYCTKLREQIKKLGFEPNY